MEPVAPAPAAPVYASPEEAAKAAWLSKISEPSSVAASAPPAPLTGDAAIAEAALQEANQATDHSLQISQRAADLSASASALLEASNAALAALERATNLRQVTMGTPDFHWAAAGEEQAMRVAQEASAAAQAALAEATVAKGEAEAAAVMARELTDEAQEAVQVSTAKANWLSKLDGR